MVDQLIPLRDASAVQMTEAFASAVTVTVPILALAAGAEARAVRDRLRRPDEAWEKKFEAHQASHEFDPARPPSEVLEYFKGVPGVPTRGLGIPGLHTRDRRHRGGRTVLAGRHGCATQPVPQARTEAP
jgi:hypothetical protein